MQERTIQVDGVLTRYLASGTGPPLVLLHGAGDNARDWSYVLPLLGRSHLVLAPDLPGYSPGSAPASDYSPARLVHFVTRFMDAVGLDRAALAGNSLGGLVALQLALSHPERVVALCLVDSAGLGRAVNPALIAQRLPGVGELAIAMGRRRPGAALRALARAVLLFGRPWRTPRSWLVEQYRAARQPGFLEATVASLRAVLGPLGQRQVLVRQLGRLPMPTLIIWGTADWVIPLAHGRRAARRLPAGRLVQLSRCGHAPQVECPAGVAEALSRFLEA
ncbi:MAG TPA: alpha/beta fold hydrolase [Actinomycetes bacterium]|nr:alpha/beta fold hydrolase [Actinomycetes bacterium]